MEQEPCMGGMLEQGKVKKKHVGNMLEQSKVKQEAYTREACWSKVI